MYGLHCPNKSDRHAESEWAFEDGFGAAAEALTCGSFTAFPAFASCLLPLWFGNFRGVCAWNSRVIETTKTTSAVVTK